MKNIKTTVFQKFSCYIVSFFRNAPENFNYGYYAEKINKILLSVNPGTVSEAKNYIASVFHDESFEDLITLQEEMWQPELLAKDDLDGPHHLAESTRNPRSVTHPRHITKLGLGAIVCVVHANNVHRILLDKQVKEIEDIDRKYGFKWTGTFTCFARDRRSRDLFGITAQHVLSDEPMDENKKEYVLSEIYLDNSEARDIKDRLKIQDTPLAASKFSGLHRVEYVYNIGRWVDVAMMPLSLTTLNGHLLENHFQSPLQISTPVIGDLVEKIGAKTGRTSGQVINTNLSLGAGQLFVVKSLYQDQPFADKGDSGSLIYKFERNRRVALGIVHKRSPGIDDINEPVFPCVKIKYCVEALNRLFNKDLQLFDDLLTPECVMHNRFHPRLVDILPEDRLVNPSRETQTDSNADDHGLFL